VDFHCDEPSFVTRGDAISAGTFWYGSKMEEWANAWERYCTGGEGNYMVCAMEGTGTLQVLDVFGSSGAGKSAARLVLRMISNFDREAPGSTVAESLRGMVFGNYPAYLPTLEAAEVVGDRIVREIVEQLGEREGACQIDGNKG
jgi:purine nucleoside permease